MAWSLRDREWASNSALPRQLLSTSNRYPDPRGAFQSGGMDKSECESRRDSPTWLGLSETGSGRRIAPCPGNSSRPRTGIQTRGELFSPAEWTSQNASLGETRPRGSVSPRPRMRLEQPCCVSLPSTLTLPQARGPNASLGETRPRGPVSPRPAVGVKQHRAPAIPLDPEPSLPRIPTRLARRSGPGWTSLLEFRSRRAARTYKVPERSRGVFF